MTGKQDVSFSQNNRFQTIEVKVNTFTSVQFSNLSNFTRFVKTFLKAKTSDNLKHVQKQSQLCPLVIIVHTGLPTKDESSETILRKCLVRFLAFRVPCRPNGVISMLNNLLNH